LYITGRPDDLRLLLRVEGDHIYQIGWAARQPRVVLGAALSDLAGLQERIANMRGIFLAAIGKAQRRLRVRTANDIDLRPLEVPTQQHDVRKALRVVRMHVGKEDRIELHGGHAYL